jgi:hypothetical protein
MHFVCVKYECSQEIRTLICEDHRLPLTVPHWRDKDRGSAGKSLLPAGIVRCRTQSMQQQTESTEVGSVWRLLGRAPAVLY